MSQTPFTGERLHEGSELFAVDLARHRAAYELTLRCARGGRLLDLGCGSGHGTAHLADADRAVVGIDRVAPDPASRRAACQYVRGDLLHLPLARASFDTVVSFQVIEHLEDPTPYVDALAELLRPDGLALVTTPNRLTSDGVNPYHVHEYVADELAACLGRRFERVEVQGVGMSEPVRAHLAARSRSIQRIVRLDPLRLRERLPRPLVEWLFARLAVVVRLASRGSAAPEVSWRDFPIAPGPAADDCLDLLAVCRGPR